MLWNNELNFAARRFTVFYYVVTYISHSVLSVSLRGRNIGVRIIDEFLAKSAITSCSNFRDTADMIAKVAFKMFLGITVEVTSWSADGNAFSLILTDNPLVEFVELPVQYQELQYCRLLCGVIMGALEMVQLNVQCTFVKDVLRGDEVSEMRVELKGILDTVMADEYKEN
jgi:hypothetical protein